MLVSGHGGGDLRGGQEPSRGEQADHQVDQAFGAGPRHLQDASSPPVRVVHPRGAWRAKQVGSLPPGPPGRRVTWCPRDGKRTPRAGTVIVAGGANLAIAAAKLVAGTISGSAAMLSEAAHSQADTTTEVLLHTALRRGARPADSQHRGPHGTGRRRRGYRAGHGAMAVRHGHDGTAAMARRGGTGGHPRRRGQHAGAGLPRAGR
ncbi:cation transporter [Micromonospora sp. CPCC 206060]|uniref:cation transporter n=1 Tax=Micromonospora sp. CPCC 206060 TaxID=3122406 RepID=UPI003FA57651